MSILDAIKTVLGAAEEPVPPIFPLDFPHSPELAAYHAIRSEAYVRLHAADAERERTGALYRPVAPNTDAPEWAPYKAASDAFDRLNKQYSARWKAAAEKVPKAEWPTYRAAEADWHFRNDSANDPHTEVSPSGRYRVEVTHHPTWPGCWRYTQGRVIEVATGRRIATIRSNYSSAWYAFVENHAADGKDYLVSFEDYQGQTVVDLSTGEKRSHVPKMAQHGFGFCWAQVWPSPDGRMIAVSGCFWACPYEVWIVDFSDPASCPPFTVLHREDTHDDFKGWIDVEHCAIGTCREVRKSDGKWVEEIDGDEDDTIYGPDGDHDPAKVETRWETYTWSRAQGLEKALAAAEAQVERSQACVDNPRPETAKWAQSALADAHEELARVRAMITRETPL